jgi:hypothetical protein
MSPTQANNGLAWATRHFFSSCHIHVIPGYKQPRLQSQPSFMNILSLAALTGLFVMQSTAPAPNPASRQSVPTPDDAKQRLELADEVNGLHGIGSPWHLKASFEVFGPDGKSSDIGTYEEWRLNDQQFRVAFHSSSLSVEEFATDHGIFYTGQWPGMPLNDLSRLISNPVPPYKPEKVVLENYQHSFGAQQLPCTSLRSATEKTPTINAASLCFTHAGAFLEYMNFSNGAIQILFKEVGSVRGHYMAKVWKSL